MECQTPQRERIYYSHINYTTQNGLPSNETYCILQDSKGFIWIGTDRGLVRYDGYQFDIFTQADGLTDNVIFHIAEDNTGRLWFAPLNNRVFSYRDDKGFQSNLDYERIDSVLAGKHFLCADLYIDSLNNIILTSEGRTREKGFLVIKPNKQVKYFDYEEEEKISLIKFNGVEFVGGFIENKYNKDEFLDIHSVLLNKRSLPVNREKLYDFLSEREPIQAINEIYENNTLVVNKRDELIEFENVSVHALGENYILLDILKQTLNTKIIFNKKKDSETNLKKPRFLIDGYSLTGSLEDVNEGIWLSTLHSGVLYFPNLKIKTSENPYNIKAIGIGEKVSFVSKDGKLFTMNYGMDSELESNGIECMDLSSNLDLPFNKSFRYNDKTTICFPPIVSHGAGSHGVQFLNKNEIINWSSTTIYKIEKDIIYKIYENKRRVTSFILWDAKFLIGHLDGLYKLENGETKKMEFDFGFIHDRVQDIKYDHIKDLLYVATMGNGFYIIQGERLISHFRRQDGLSSNTINQLFLDANATLWIATNSGLNYYDYSKKENGIKQIYAPTELIGSNNITQVAVIDSAIYIGTDFGFSVLDQKQIEDKKDDIFPVHLGSILLNGKKISFDSINNDNLNYNQNNLEIHFKAISFKKFGNITYRYRLTGLDSIWITTKDTRAVFLSIPSGKYQFELQALNENGTWLESSVNLIFTIDKAFWQEDWFFLSIYLIIVATSFLVFKVYYDNMKKRERLTVDINRANQLALTSQLNPHFVFNSLNSIQNFILKKDREKSSEYLGQFSKLMREIFENSKRLYVPLFRELKAVKNYLELEKLRYDRFFSYSIRINDDVDIEQYLIPSLIIQPIVENAILHGIMHKESGDGELKIEIQSNNDSIIISVYDNGIGRSKSKKRNNVFSSHVSGGLLLTRQRLTLLQKAMKKPASIKFEDLKNEEGQTVGTKVVLIVPKILRKI